MAGRGPAAKHPEERRRRNAPTHEWKPAEGVGWRFGAVPDAPAGLMPASLEAWRVWFGAWFAVFWTPEDLPGLRQLVRVYDQVERGEFHRANEMRLQMDTYGITPKGQQDRRWKAPEPAKPGGDATVSPYAHLRAVE